MKKVIYVLILFIVISCDEKQTSEANRTFDDYVYLVQFDAVKDYYNDTIYYNDYQYRVIKKDNHLFISVYSPQGYITCEKIPFCDNINVTNNIISCSNFREIYWKGSLFPSCYLDSSKMDTNIYTINNLYWDNENQINGNYIGYSHENYPILQKVKGHFKIVKYHY